MKTYPVRVGMLSSNLLFSEGYPETVFFGATRLGVDKKADALFLRPDKSQACDTTR